MLATDLHIHLDGSLRAETLVELARRHGTWPATADGDQLVSRLTFRPGMTLATCLERFGFVVALLQSRASLVRTASELVRDAFRDGVRHVEIRFCPFLHTRGGLSAGEAVESALEGIEDGASELGRSDPESRMSAGLVLVVLEGSAPDNAERLVDLAVRYADAGVLGVDVAGDESLFDARRYARALGRAAESGLGIAVHAGEAGPPDHVRKAVEELGARRIGHGVAAAADPQLLDDLAARGVTIEVCLSSNVHTGAIPGIAAHPLPRFLDHGVSATLATDNTFFSSTTLSAEYDLAARELGLGTGALVDLAVAGARAAFVPSSERSRLEALVRPSARSDDNAKGRAP